MGRLLLLVALLSLVVFQGCGGGKMKVESVFKSGGDIPRKYTCDGSNVSPGLKVFNVPEDAKTLAIIVDDPDAPIGTFVHWVAWNISVNGREVEIPEAVPRENSFMLQGLNDFRRMGYDGPCPPPGHSKHRYHFKVYALDTTLTLRPGARKKDLERAMKGHILDQAEIVGLYGR